MLEFITCNDQLGKLHTFSEEEFIRREAIYGIHTDDEGILLVQDTLSGKWEVPGGGKDDGGESDYDCLARELREETGLRLDKMLERVDFFTSYFFDLSSQEPWKTMRNFWLITIAGGEIRERGNNEDVQTVARIALDEIAKLDIDLGVARALGKAIVRLRTYPRQC